MRSLRNPWKLLFVAVVLLYSSATAWIEPDYPIPTTTSSTTTTTALATQQPETTQGATGGGTVAHWTFDEMGGDTLHDVTGNGHHGVVHGATWDEGLVDGALRFDGDRDYVVVPDHDQLTEVSQLTVEAWVKLDRLKSSLLSTIACKWGTGGRSDNSWVLQVDSRVGNKEAFRVADGITETVIYSDHVPPLGEWIHLVATWDGTATRLYENGVLLSSTSWSRPLSNSWAPLYIGSAGLALEQYLIGKLDEMRILDRALSPAEIADRYETMRPKQSPARLIAHWTFDEADGDTLHDLSGNGHHGAVTCSMWVDGVKGTALDFDGIDDHVIVPDSTLAANVSALTVETWVKADNYGRDASYTAIAGKWGSGGNSDDSWKLGIHRTRNNRAYFQVSNGTTYDWVFTRDSLDLNAWVYLVGTWDGSMIRIYNNGVCEDSLPWTSGLNNDPASFCLATRDPSLVEQFDGAIDETRILSYALSSDSVMARYRALKPSEESAYEINLGMRTAHVPPEEDVWVPIYLANHEDISISACQFTLSIDTSVVSLVEVVKDSGIAKDWLVTYNDQAANAIDFAMAGETKPLGYGEGELLRCRFRVKAGTEMGDYSRLLLSDISVDENNTITVTTTEGRIVVDVVDIVYGDVTGNAIANVFDADKILQFVVGSLELPDSSVPNFTPVVADVSGNGAVTSYDAALVFQYSVGLIPHFPVETQPALTKRTAFAAASAGEAVLQLTATPGSSGGETVYTMSGTNLRGFVAGEFALQYDPGRVDLGRGEITTPVRGASLKARVEAPRNLLKVALTTNDDIDDNQTVSLFTISLPLEQTELDSALVLSRVLINEGRISTNVSAGGLIDNVTAGSPSGLRPTGAVRVVKNRGVLAVVGAESLNGTVTIHDLGGRSVVKKPFGNTHACRVPIGGLAEGLYIYHVRYGTKHLTNTFIVRE